MELEIIFSDEFLVAVNKPSSVAVQPDKTGDVSLMDLLKENLGSEVFLVHRLDRPVSGLVLFARTQEAAARMGEIFQKREADKTYVAFVSGKLPEEKGTLIHYFRKNEGKNKSYAQTVPAPGLVKGELSYKTLVATDRYTGLEIQLITGRHHQIRAQLSAVGCPVKGDVKYGARRANQDRSVHLHAWKISFEHPFSRQMLQLLAPLPQEVLFQQIPI